MHRNVESIKGTILAKPSKIYLPICLVDDGLDMPSSIYDSLRAITRFLLVKTSSTHHLCFVDTMTFYVFICKQST